MFPATAHGAGRNRRARLFRALRVCAIGILPVAWCPPDGAVARMLSLNVQVDSPEGGQVDGMPGGGHCRSSCAFTIDRPRRFSLLAEPRPGYRFAGWQGACETTLGPLCTVAVIADTTVGAHFEPYADPTGAAYGVLLLPGEAETPSVWNKVVDRQFQGHCPVIYGGVILGKLGERQAPELQCYRIRFGYYGALRPGYPISGDGSSVRQLASEIRAAVAGLMDRRPGLRLVLAGKGRPLAAALEFAQTPSPQRLALSGVLAVADGQTHEPAETAHSSMIPAVDAARIGTQAWRLFNRR